MNESASNTSNRSGTLQHDALYFLRRHAMRQFWNFFAGGFTAMTIIHASLGGTVGASFGQEIGDLSLKAGGLGLFFLLLQFWGWHNPAPPQSASKPTA